MVRTPAIYIAKEKPEIPELWILCWEAGREGGGGREGGREGGKVGG